MYYGVTSAPSIFQSVMDNLLNGIPGVQCYWYQWSRECGEAMKLVSGSLIDRRLGH